jgi:catechol 2,3-dioxygenase-like lactoylglutathione lyase family enzyme
MAGYGYDHIHLRSPDPAGTAQWYHRMFDARLVETPQPSGPPRVDVDLDGLMIFIAGALPAGEELHAPRDPHYGIDHFGLRVADLDETVAELRRRGAEFAVEPRATPTGLKIAFIRGPDDVRVELVQRPQAVTEHP